MMNEKLAIPCRLTWHDSLLMVASRLIWPIVMLAWFGVAPSGGVDAHDWYTELHQPGTGRSCCGRFDCRPLLPEQIRYLASGTMQFFLDDQWRDVDPAVILELPSPDGRVHACWNAASKRLLCVILPGAL
jgi:hypothetical protein